MSQVHFCILCNKVPQPQKQAYFRNVTEESLLSLKELLNKHYGEQEVLRCLEELVVLCNGACQTSLKKLFKLKQDFQSLEKDVIEKMAGRFKQMEVDTEGPTTPQRSFNLRVGLNTPERDTLSRTIAETPCVSVS